MQIDQGIIFHKIPNNFYILYNRWQEAPNIISKGDFFLDKNHDLGRTCTHLWY